MFDTSNLPPLSSGTPYERDTVLSVDLLRQPNTGEPVIEAVFGNQWATNHVPMTREAALHLYDRLGEALRESQR